MTTLRLSGLALLTVCCAGLASAQDTEALAKHLVQMSGRADNPRGVCAVPGGGELAFAIARHSEFFVATQEPTQAAQQAAAARADRDGLLGRRMLVAEAPRETFVLADGYANLYVLTGVTDEELRKLDALAILRKLAPQGGRAIVGLAKSESGTLNKAGLESWAKGFGKDANCQVVTDAMGSWAIATRSALPGAAEWTHRFFEPHNNPVSTDTAFRWPPMTQWLAKPFHDGGSLALMAGGRVAIVFAGNGSKAARRMDKDSPNRNMIQVRDACNGQELWRRTGDPNFPVERRLSQFILLPDVAYLIQPPTNTVKVLDAGTGAELRGFDLSAHGDEAKWIGYEDGVLCAMLGPKDAHQDTGDQWRWFDRQYRAYGKDANDPYLHDLGDTLVGIDTAAGTVIWTYRVSRPGIHEATLGMRGGRLYALSRGDRLLCLDGKTGRVVWENKAASDAWQTLAKRRVAVSFGHHGGLLVSAGGAGIVYIPNVGGMGFDLTDGNVLWSYSGAYHPVIRGDKVYTASGAYGTNADKDYANAVFDLKTGAIDTAMKGRVPVGSACGSISQSPYFHCGSWGITYDFERNVNLGGRTYNDHRNNCNAVGLFAEGMLFSQAYECTCAYKTRGQVMEVPRGDLPVGRPAGPERLRRSDVKTIAQPGEGDWTSPRANTSRSASIPASVPAQARLLWQARPARFEKPLYNFRDPGTAWEAAQPIAAGDVAYFSGPDGALRAYGIADGEPRWTFYTGGKLYQAPTWWQGSLLVGSGDGYVYRLDARTGREIWRFHAAPMERRMFVYGHLVSTWAVATGVTVDDGRAYFAAGLLNNNGAHLYCLDAAAGTLVWQQNDIGGHDDPTLEGLSPATLPAIADGRLWIRDNAFSLADGSHGKVGDGGPFLRTTASLNADTLLLGGWRFFGDQSEYRALKGACGVWARPVDVAPHNRPAIVAFADLVNGFAAWNEKALVLLPMEQTHGGKNQDAVPDRMRLWPRPALDAALAKHFEANQAEKRPALVPADQLLPPAWDIQRARFFACALADNAIVATFGEWDEASKSQKPCWARPGDRWYIGAFSFADGRELWRVQLPSEPREDGLAIAVNGTVLVQLLNGGFCAAGGK